MFLMDELRQLYAALEATVKAGFASEAKRLDDFKTDITSNLLRMHGENSERLERIEEKQDKTNGNVARHDAEIKNIAENVRSLWQRCNDLAKRIDRFLRGRPTTDDESGDGQHSVSRDDLRWVIALVVGTALLVSSAIFGAMKLAGKL